MDIKNYDYDLAFSRNLGFVSKEEQKLISKITIGIPGMGGVGGYHLHTLARMGFKNFHIADFDYFDVHNFNRQIGAKISSLGKSKVEVMKEMILDIVPDGTVKIFPDGVNEKNRDEFLKGIDYLVDGLDVYVIRERIALFDLALSRGIPVLTAGPIGMGTCILTFSPHGMTFSDYFCINESMSDNDLLAHFIAGINPRPVFQKYLKYKDEIDMNAGRAPSLHVGVLAATTTIGAEIFKLVLKRGEVKFAPRSTQYDFYFCKSKSNFLPFGNKGIFQRILIWYLKKMFLSS